ncbi:HlyC/CorC family transporter [Snodgrassella sp. CFCC 13594]|uniref:HlyC/CorC family transporter n=1 Tax=Snodgrassella sp. CFCC 13594 TaxID=1775559 RepID=UPI0008300B5C|nr:transporter associated domain-containing protein [Snodgrassella sp. CFCC 13594]
MDDTESKPPSFFERLISRITGDAPENAEDVAQTLREAHENQIFDADTLQLLENSLDFADLEVRDAMITRSQMDVIKADEPLERIMPYIVDTAHSRFPVIGEDKDQILGILHAKDLLKYWNRPDQFQLEQVLRAPVFVPEGKSLNSLLKEFREQRNHMAIVVDEFGGISGLVTFEDIIEQIIGDIEDEFDEDDSADNIFAVSAERFRVNAITEIADINAFFGTQYSDEEVDTIGGLVIQEFGHLPVRGEKITIGKLNFTVARADARRLHTLMVTPNNDENQAD